MNKARSRLTVKLVQTLRDPSISQIPLGRPKHGTIASYSCSFPLSKMAPGAGSNLRDRDTFPPFSETPNENYINKKYWKLVNGNTYIPRRHWCFLGEIEAFNNGLVRVLLNVRDMEGHRLPIYFHTEDRGASIYDSCKEGYTVAVLYPAQHYFMDGDSGFRVEDITSVKVQCACTSYCKIVLKSY